MSDKKATLKCDMCGEKTSKPFRTLKGKVACKPECAGFILAELARSTPRKSPKDKTQKQIRGQMLRDNKALGVNFIPVVPTPVPFLLSDLDKIRPTTEAGWGQVEFERNIFHVHEITLLVKVDSERAPRVFGHMINVMAYTDPELGLLLRPNVGGVKATMADFPKAISIAKRAPDKRHEVEEVPAPKYKKEPIAPKELTPVEGASFGNMCQDPSSKRYWLVESMAKGGTPKEIVKRAAKLSVEAGYFENEDAYLQSMPSNPMAISKMFTWWKDKLNKAGIRHRILEVEGQWNVDLVKR